MQQTGGFLILHLGFSLVVLGILKHTDTHERLQISKIPPLSACAPQRGGFPLTFCYGFP